jgi:hypothetical protein
MSNKELKPLASLLGAANSGLAKLAEAAHRRTDLSDYMRKNLGPSLAGGFMHCNLREDETLVVTATSPEWAARLRFASAQFLKLSQERGLNVKTIKVRVGT